MADPHGGIQPGAAYFTGTNATNTTSEAVLYPFQFFSSCEAATRLPEEQINKII